MAIYLFSEILKFTKYSIKLIEKLSRRHLINSSDVFVIKGFTVVDYLFNICCIGCQHGYCNKSGECICDPFYSGDLCDCAECSVGCHKHHGYCK